MVSLLSPQLMSVLRAHLPHPSLSHVLSASDITLTLPHCPTYKEREGAGEERRQGWIEERIRQMVAGGL